MRDALIELLLVLAEMLADGGSLIDALRAWWQVITGQVQVGDRPAISMLS